MGYQEPPKHWTRTARPDKEKEHQDWVTAWAQAIEARQTSYMSDYSSHTVVSGSPRLRKKTSSPKTDRLKQFLDAKKVESVVLGDVSRHLQTSPDDRDTTLIHPSEMARKNWCVRGTLFRLRGCVRPKEAHNLRSELIFGEGHLIHEKWQGWFREMGILYGSWYCPACEDRILGSVLELPVRGCDGQVKGTHLWKYREVPLENPARRIGGHADAIIARPTGDHLIEIKSVGPGTLRKLGLLSEEESDEDSPSKFSRITHILSDHYRQTQIYLRLTQDTDKPVDKGLVIYEQKADQQVREFLVDYDPKVTDSLFSSAADIVWAINNGRDLACSNEPLGDCDQCSNWTAP